MKNQTKAILIIGFLLIVITGGLLYSFGIVENVALTSTFLTIDKVEIDGMDKIRVFGVAKGAEQLLIDFTPTKLNKFLSSSGVEATKTVTGDIRLTEQIKTFQVQKQYSEVFYKYKAEDLGYQLTCTAARCENNIPNGWTYAEFNQRTLTTRCVCFYKKAEGINSILVGAGNTQSTISFDIGDSTGELVTTNEYNAITLNDGKTKVEWTGDLSNTYEVSAPSAYNVLFVGSKYDRLISNNAYLLAKEKSDNFEEVIRNDISTINTISAATTAYNNQIEAFLADKTSEYESSIRSNGVSLDNEGIIVDLKTPTNLPTFIITLDADKVGIRELKGTPKLLNCENIKINSGDTKFPTVTVKNVGVSGGEFSGTVTCTDTTGLSVAGTVGTEFVEKDETTDMSVLISGTNIEEGIENSKCTINIVDLKSRDSDYCTINVDVEYQAGIVCSPNTVLCISDKILRTCNSNGQSYSDKSCSVNCINTAGVGKCSDEPIPEPLECNPIFERNAISDSCGFNPLCYMGIMKPTQKEVCELRPWVSAVGFVLFLVILYIVFVKRLFIKETINKIKSSGKTQKKP